MSDVDRTVALCQLLADEGVGVWRPDGPVYAAAEVGIFYGELSASPDRAIAVRFYMAQDPTYLGDGPAVRWAQVRCRGARGDVAGADRIAEAVFAVLHARYYEVGFSRLSRTSVAPLGADENGRQERADNYMLILSPTPLEATP